MQILLIGLGLVLIAVGIFFALYGFGDHRAGGAASVAKLEGPAWLILIGLGIALVVFAATQDFDSAGGNDGPGNTPVQSDFPTAVPERTPSQGVTPPAVPDSPPAEPVGCTATIRNPFASIRETPEPFGQEIARIPSGTYQVIETTTVSFAGSNQRWLKLSVDGRDGWIEDSTIFIDAKSGCSF